MGTAARPRKTSLLTYVVYGVIIAIILVLFAMLGAAMDLSVTPEGKINIADVGKGFNMIVNNPEMVIKAFGKSGSYAPKMLVMGAVFIGVYIMYKYSEDKKRLHRKGVEYGSAKWGDQKEIKSLADKNTKPYVQPILTSDGKRVFDKKGNFVGVIIDNNILLTKELFLSLDSRQHLLNLNVLIIGGSGAGKTRFFAKPNIMQLNTSYVITDPKGEILQSTGKMLKEAGYELRVCNLIQMQHSDNYNPFNYVYEPDGSLSADNIKKMINVLFKATKGDGEKEDFWSQKGQTMLEAIVFLLFEESEYNAEFDNEGKIIPETRDKTHLNFFSVTEKMRKLRYPPSGGNQPDGFFMEKNKDESDAEFEARRSQGFLCSLDKDFIELEKRKPDSLALRLYKEIRNAPEETGQSFLSSANVKTFMFNMESLRNLTCCDNIELEKLGDRKTALFIIISATDSTYNFLAAMLYTQLFDTLNIRANFKYGGRLPVHVRCIMDEFANIGQIPEFEKVIAYVRSLGISINIILQNMAQLKSRYEKTWEGIVGNCDTKLFLGGDEESTLKWLSEILGKETIDIRGRNKTSGGKQKSTSENNSLVGRELMQPDEIATMPISDCIVKMRSHNPFYCKKYPIENHPNYDFLGDADENNMFDIKTVNAVTVEEYERSCKKVDTNINDSEITENNEQNEKIESVFKRESYTITADTLEINSYEEAEMYSDEYETDPISEEYTNEIMYGQPSDLEEFDLGEPIKKQREVESDDAAHSDISLKNEEDIKHYDDVDDEPESFETIEEEMLENAETVMNEVFGELSDVNNYATDVYF